MQRSRHQHRIITGRIQCAEGTVADPAILNHLPVFQLALAQVRKFLLALLRLHGKRTSQRHGHQANQRPYATTLYRQVARIG